MTRGMFFMRLKLQTKIAIFNVLIIVIVTGMLTYQSSQQLKYAMYQELETQGYQLAESVNEKVAISESFYGIVDNLMGEKIYIASEAMNLVGEENMTNELIDDFLSKVTVDEIYVINENREIAFSNIRDYIGWQYPAGHPLDPVFNGSEHGIMEDVRGDLISGNMIKYGGTAMDGNLLAAQVGIRADVITEILNEFSSTKLMDGLYQNPMVLRAHLVTMELAPEELEKKLAVQPYDDTNRIPVISAGLKDSEDYVDYTDEVGLSILQTGQRTSRAVELEDGRRGYEVLVPYTKDGQTAGVLALTLSLENLDTQIAANQMKSFMTAGVLIILAILMASFGIKLLMTPLKRLSEQLDVISAGDFTVEQDVNLLKATDDLGTIARAVDKMRKTLSSLIVELKVEATSVSDGAESLTEIMNETSKAVEETAKAAESLAVQAQEQAQEGEKVNASANDLGEVVAKGQEGINQVNGQVVTVETLSKKGEVIIEQLAKITHESISKTDTASKGIGEIEETVEAMKNFMDEIRSIATQTNLLALNASIEAARAGEAGRGFAVVASEIRDLAEETNNTVEQVEGIINNINEKTVHATSNIGEVTEVTEEQMKTLKQTQEIFEEIEESVNELVDSMAGVVEVTDEVAINKDKIMEAVGVLAGLTESLSSACEEISASTEEQSASIVLVNELSDKNKDISNDLRDQVGKFKTL
jgi:methyl-accepting chemotaxis protein